MLKNLQLRSKLMLAISLTITLAIVAQGIGTQLNLRRVIEQAEQTELRQSMAALEAAVAAETRLAEALSALVANQPAVQQRFAAGDREWLQAALLPAYQRLERDYGVVQFQFHTPPARSFLRLHLLDQYGDDLSAIRHSIVASNRTRRPQRGLEVGVAGLGARGMVPIFDAQRHLGVVEFGMSFGRAFFDDFRATMNVEAGLHLLRDGGIETFAATYGEAPLLTEAQMRAALAGAPQFDEIRHAGRDLAVYAALIRDYSGQPIGVVEVARERARYQQLLAAAMGEAWLIGGLALGLGLALALLIARRLAGRIRALKAGVEQVAAGDLTTPIAVVGGDELTALARAAETLRDHLRQLVAEVETNAAAVHGAAREIATAVDGQAANSSQMSASVAEITSTMEELSASAVQVAEYSDGVESVAQQTHEESRAGAAAMQALVERMQVIRTENQSALAEIVALGTKSKEISRIMEIIDTVADQTKLIAFNAALEAASAGESGKRFGVVAAEIRRLADSVTESTSEIALKVTEIQESISRLVVTSEKGTTGIDQGMQESAHAASVLDALVDKAGETNAAAHQINLSSQQQRTASNQVVVALREIVSASADTASAVGRIASIATGMATRAADLKQRVDSFTLHATPPPDA